MSLWAYRTAFVFGVRHRIDGLGSRAAQCGMTPGWFDTKGWTVVDPEQEMYETYCERCMEIEVEEEQHVLTIVPRPKLDAERLVAARCSCGYRSAPGGQHDVMRAFQAHVRGKADYEERRRGRTRS